MDSRTLVRKTISGENNTGITPLYGWVGANLSKEISEAFGSVKNFEDHYDFDMAHLFSEMKTFDKAACEKIIQEEGELLPERLIAMGVTDVNDESRYDFVKKELAFYQGERGRFCYVQTPGIFEALNDVLGIENHMMYMVLYPEEMLELYRLQAEWNKQYAMNILDLGADMIHVSDDWGSQTNLMFSPVMLKEMVAPFHKITADAVKQRGALLSMHSDGCILQAVDTIVNLGYNLLHPWQESAGMSYDVYLKHYQDKFALLGGICVQSTLGFGDYDRLKSEIERVFATLKGKRWICCTSHYVQNHCSIEELVYAFDLAKKLCGK